MKKLDQNGHAQAKVFERKDEPGVWSVGWIDEDGGIEQAIFIGPDAEKRVREYASFRYGYKMGRARSAPEKE